MRLRAAATAYASRGWPVFPCKPGEKVPATAHGVKDATCDTTQVDAWWSDMTEANIGIATGEPSGLWVLDVDGLVGLDALADYDHGLPGTLTSWTPSGGWHFVFHDPGGLGNTASKIAPKVDSRGTGGYVVVPPSVHPNGGRYQWGAKQEPEGVPGWLIRLVRQPPKDRVLPKAAVTSGDVAGYVGKALEAEAEAVAQAIEGTRNDTLNRAGWNLGTLSGAGLLDRDVAYTTLAQAAAQAGLEEREIRQTLGRAIDDGAQHPREGVTA